MPTTLNYLKCSMPNCHKTVGQHNKKNNKNKQVCSAHRNHRKHEVDQWKLNSGCANKNGQYGFPCGAKIITHPAQLDINHIDGINSNRDPKNIEVLCKLCHPIVTLANKHHLTPTESRRAKLLNTKLFDFG